MLRVAVDARSVSSRKSAALHADPFDQADLVAKIRALDTDAALRARLIEAGVRRAHAFSWERAARATLDVYREAVSVR